MKSNLTINDPLDGQDVTIIITLPASEKPTDQRQALVSVGIANEMPVIKTGAFGTIADLINNAWKVFGVQTETTKAEKVAAEQPRDVATETAVSPELIAEAEIEAEEVKLVETIEPEPVRPAPAPKPASNLSLF